MFGINDTFRTELQTSIIYVEKTYYIHHAQ